MPLSNGFGTNGSGKVITPVGNSYDYAYSVALQPDGKIVVAGYAIGSNGYDFAVTRYNADGSLDATFGSGGKVLTPVGSSTDQAYSVALQPDGKIVVAGYAYGSNGYDFAVTRYNANGSLDATFGSGGKVLTPVGSSHDYAYSVALQPDGKIVVAGYANGSNSDDFAVTRYNVNGSLDATFGSGGKVITPVGSSTDQAYSVALQPDGKIVLAGYAIGSNGYDFAVTRYNADGSLDATFGSGGKVLTPVGSSTDQAYSVALQPDGKIVVAGYAIGSNGYDFAVTRYNANGSLDPTFGSGGKVLTPVGSSNDQAYSVALQPDGKIVLAGINWPDDHSPGHFAVTRYNANGSLDPTFGSGGKVLTDVRVTGGPDMARSVALQPDGKLVVAGYARVLPSSPYSDFAVVRYNADGSLDVDNLPPTVVITSTGVATNAASQTVTGTGEAGTTVKLYDYGSTIALATATVAANGTWSAAVTLSGQGTHSLVATDTDAAGNVGISSEVLYKLGILSQVGKDTLTGGAGHDLFIYTATNQSMVKAADVIQNFTHGEDDIDLSAIAGIGDVQGPLKAASIKVAAHSVAWTVDKSGDTQVYVNTTDNAEFQPQAQMKIVLTGHPTLDAGDFVLA
jgi:uncharacterized delta-60 repeat protein